MHLLILLSLVVCAGGVTIHNTTNFRIWEPFSKALPKFTRLELPRNSSTVRQIPMEDLIFKLRGMRNIEVADNSWPLWAYLVIDSMICLLIGGGVFLYLRYRKQKKALKSETPSCLGRLAMICGGGDKVDEDEPRDQSTSVSYSKETDEATILQGRAESAPPETGFNVDAVVRQLYPGLPRMTN